MKTILYLIIWLIAAAITIVPFKVAGMESRREERERDQKTVAE